MERLIRATAPLARLTSPIGIEGIEGKAPAVIAVAVVAQLLRNAQRPRVSFSPPCDVDCTAP